MICELCMLFGAVDSVSLQVPLGNSLAGYGSISRRSLNPFSAAFNPPEHYFKNSFEQEADGVRVGVMVLKKAQTSTEKEKKLAFFSFETVAMSAEMRLDLIDKIRIFGFDESNTFVSATHTHSGPGGLSKSALWQFVATDRFQNKFYESTLNQAANLLKNSIEKFQPVNLEHVFFQSSGVQVNRRDSAGPVDNQANIILMNSLQSKSIIGGIINYAVHGTALGPSNLKLSGDVPGAITRAVEKEIGGNSHFLYLSGASGDTAPSTNGMEALQTLPLKFVEQMRPALKNKLPLAADWNIYTRQIDLPKPKLNTEHCGVFSNGSFLASLLPDVSVQKWLPSQIELTKIKLGNLDMFVWPGEPVAAVGQELFKVMLAQTAQKPLILALTNDYLGYFANQWAFQKSNYEACSSFYGSLAPSKIIEVFKKIEVIPEL